MMEVMQVRQLTLPVLCATTGLLIGASVSYVLFQKSTDATNCRDTPLLSPMTDCGSDDSRDRIKALDATLDEATRAYVSEGKAVRVSVWTRNLITKQWAASNENEIYSPASLLKLPLLIAYYKFSEVQPSVLQTQIAYTPASKTKDETLRFTPPTTLVAGQSYMVSDLLKRMMKDSDNDASITLYDKADPSFYDQTLLDLGIRIPTGSSELDYVTVRTYANIFRMLYNASYLNRDLSEQALELMTDTTFKGIVQPLPDGTKVAHKFGERTVIGPDGSVVTHELHDCGIVYKQPDPYSLCIMTEGKDFDDLLLVIEDISKLVYAHI